MLRPIDIDGILEQRCVRCHTDRRFAKLNDMTQPQIMETIQRMRSHSGANIPADEVREIEAALLAFRCTSCHGEGVLNQLFLMPPRRARSLPASQSRDAQLGLSHGPGWRADGGVRHPRRPAALMSQPTI